MSRSKEDITKGLKQTFQIDRISVTLWIIAVFGYGYLFGMVSYWFALGLPIVILIRWVAANRMYSQGLMVGHLNDAEYVYSEVDKLLLTRFYNKIMRKRQNGRNSGNDFYTEQ